MRSDRPSPAIILDVDGTLVDSNDAHARAWVDAFAEAGLQVSAERVRRAIGMGGDKLIPHVAGLTEDSPEGRRISERRSEIFRTSYVSQVRPFPRVRELIERLAADGFTLVVASSASEDDLRTLLEIAGIADLIESRTSSDDAERSKPDPDIVHAALKDSGAGSAEAIMLGDTPYDVEAARRAGIAIIGVECGGWRRDELSGAAAIYADPADLYARYDESPIAGLMMRSRPRPVERSSGAPAWWFAAPLLILGAVLIIQATRRPEGSRSVAMRSRRREEDEDEYVDAGATDPAGRSPRTLSARDRAALRRLIARTS
jgi:HAD superfamily hydrolase (TIGR01509 family)